MLKSDLSSHHVCKISKTTRKRIFCSSFQTPTSQQVHLWPLPALSPPQLMPFSTPGCPQVAMPLSLAPVPARTSSLSSTTRLTHTHAAHYHSPVTRTVSPLHTPTGR